MTEPEFPPASPPPALPGIARALVGSGQIPQALAEAIYAKSRQRRSSFIAELSDAGVVPAREVARVVSSAFGMPMVELDRIDLQRLPAGLLDGRLQQAHKIIALARRGDRLVVATADPTDHAVAEQIKFSTQLGVDWVVAEHDKLARALAAMGASAGDSLDAGGGEIDFGLPDDGTEPPASGEAGAAQDAPIVRFVHRLLADAFEMRASDLHFEPFESSYRIRFRIDGELREIASPPPAIKDRLASRIKVMSRLDIAEKRVPQDGRMKLKLGPGRAIDFRVSTLPTLFGEKIVIRILDPGSARMGIDALGYEAEEKARLLSAIRRPHGMILMTGPTGSGKTVSLYTCLNLLNSSGVNIATVEDPSEINLPGVNQVNVNEKAGLSFAAALRAFLRQDPDIIMVGEIRDQETADIAIKAAQTGHLVLSTLHTNDAPATLTRLRNMGIAPFNIASSVILITAQRLVRRLCPACKRAAGIPHATLLEAGFHADELDGSWTPFEAVGCGQCNNGYQGRIGIYQVMPVSGEIQRIILREGSAREIAAQSEAEGVRPLRASGLRKVRAGLTSLEEVLAATDE